MAQKQNLQFFCDDFDFIQKVIVTQFD